MNRICRIARFLGIATFVVALALANRGFCQLEPWYQDLDYHWARLYISVLHKEGVTDGWVYYRTDNPVTYYRPDWESTRAQLAVLLCKVFSLPASSPAVPSYPDVPRGYYFLQNKPGWQWIEGALSGGIAFVPAGTPFLPDSPITRQDAVELLIRALELYEYAISLSEGEVESLLSSFHDSSQVDSERRHTMACAIKLGIIDGYEDDTLRPKQPMLRSEAATVVYRSCLIRVEANPSSFSPDGDGRDETVAFTLSHLKNRQVTQWQMVLCDLSGTVVHSFNPYGAGGQPPPQIIWDGRGQNGSPIPAGQYTYQAWVKDTSNNQFFSIRKPIELIRHTLTVSCAPRQCTDGSPVTVTATTNPAARKVTASFADGDTVTLIPSNGGTRWTGSKVVGPYLPPGEQTAHVYAQFDGAVREGTTTFTRVRVLWINPSVNPNPANGGQTVALDCTASPGVTQVMADAFGQEYLLTRHDTDGHWVGAAPVPIHITEGDYPVVFTGIDGEDQIQETVILNVGASVASRLTYVLTK